MDRARRAEPYSNATVWTREIARNLAGHLARISKAHSYVDTKAPKTRLLPKFQHHGNAKRCTTSPAKVRQTSIAPKEDEPQDREEEDDGAVRGVQSARNEMNDEVAHRDDNKSGRRRPKTMVKRAKNPSKKTRMEVDRLEVIAHENQRLHDRLAKIASPTPRHLHHAKPSPIANTGHSCSEESAAHETSIPLHHQPPPTRSSSHDYNKKQEQLKIWTENQALSKRLRSTKGTLNCKEWEKDDKWNQHYLRSQEKRRISLQQELLKAQMSPQVCLGGKAVKAEAQSSRSPSAARKDAANAMMSPREGTNRSDIPHATAANHRRIMMLRQQRSAPSLEQQQHKVSRDSETTKQPDNQQENSIFRPQDQDVVDVHFTFSRARNKRLEIDVGMDPVAISPGVFSPAVELESALDAMSLDEAPECISLQAGAMISEDEQGTYKEEEQAILPDASDACKAEEQTISEVVDDSEQPDCTFNDSEINATVFDALQDSIDQIADAFANEMGSREATEALVRNEPESMALQTEESTELPSSPPETADEGDLADIEAMSAAMPPPEEQATSGSTIDNIEELKPRQKQIEDPVGYSPPEMAAQAASNQRNEDESFVIGNVDQAADSVVEPLSDAPEEPPEAAAQHREEEEEDYEEEPFDDDAGHVDEIHDTPADVSPQSKDTGNGEHEHSSDTTAAAMSPQYGNDAEDDTSGYGSEFDNDHNDEEGEVTTTRLKIDDDVAHESRLHTDDYNNESYGNEDDYGDESDHEATDAQKESEKHDDELSYSDDGFEGT
ncbi:hypothetical protein FI667_g9817, partial [Globisporangium splendens]